MSSNFLPPAPPSSNKSKQTKIPSPPKTQAKQQTSTSIYQPPLLLEEIPQLVYSPVITFEKQKPKSPTTKKPEHIIRIFTIEPLKHDATDRLLEIPPTFITSIKEKNKDPDHKSDKWYKKLYNKLKKTFTRKNKKVIPIGGRKIKIKTKKQQKSKRKTL
jgi:hypothetical protein